MSLLDPPDGLPKNGDRVTVITFPSGSVTSFFVIGRTLHLSGRWVILLGRTKPRHGVEVPATAFAPHSGGGWIVKVEEGPSPYWVEQHVS